MKNLRRHLTLLKVLASSSPSQRKQLLKEVSSEDIKILSEVCSNILRGNIPLSSSLYEELKKHKHIIRHIAYKTKHKNPERLKRYLRLQKGGLIPILPLLLSGLTSLVSGVAGRAISKAIGHG